MHFTVNIDQLNEIITFFYLPEVSKAFEWLVVYLLKQSNARYKKQLSKNQVRLFKCIIFVFVNKEHEAQRSVYLHCVLLHHFNSFYIYSGHTPVIFSGDFRWCFF